MFGQPRLQRPALGQGGSDWMKEIGAMSNRQLVLTRLVPGAMILILVYLVAAITLHLLPTGFNPVTHELSDYANGPYGWLMTVGFLGLGLGSLLLVWIVARGHDAGLLSPATLVLLGVWGAARFLAAFFHDDLPGAVPTVHGRIHNVLGALAFFSVSTAMILASRRFRREPRWSSLSRLSLVLGVLALTATLLFVGGVESSPTHPVLGLSERVFYVCAIAWLLLVGSRIARTRT
jgi:hypothetical protein